MTELMGGSEEVGIHFYNALVSINILIAFNTFKSI